MSRTSKRVWSGLVALAIGLVTVPLLSSPGANAAGVPQPGGAEVRNAGGAAPLDTGNSSTTWTLSLPAGAACGGDSANDGYRVQSYIVPHGVDPSTLTFNASGPIPAGLGANLRQPLFDTNGTAYVNAQTANATTPPGPGPVVNIPDFRYSVFSPGNIPAGTYNIGIACTLGAASATQMKEYWNTKMTFTTDPGGGPAQVTWVAGVPANDSACTFVPPPGGITSAQISWYPANPGSMSGLEVGCVFANDTAPGSSMISPSFTVHDSEVVSYHNGAAKPVTNTALVAPGALSFQLNTAANGIVGLPVAPTQMNRIISGPGIAPRTVVKSMTAGGVVTLNRATIDADPITAGNQSIPIGAALKIDNAIARSVDDATRTAPDLLNSVQANFTAADVGLSISGTGIPNGATIASVISASQVKLNTTFASVQPTVSIGGTLLVSTVRQITGVTTTSAVRLQSPTGLGTFVASDIGLRVSGSCTQLTAGTGDDTVIPANTVITATPTAANADTTGGLVAGWSGCTIVVGAANANAPVNGETVASQGVQLNLNPSLVAGSDECGNDVPEGFALVGKWYNPGAFQGIGATNEQPGPTSALPAALATKAVGQIFFDTSAADFSAFVIERRALTAGDPNAVVHYDIVFPFTPTGLALCPATATSPGLGFLLDVEAISATQAAAAPGTGRPGTGQVRNVQMTPSGGYTTTVQVDSQGPTAFTPASSFRRLCVYPHGSQAPINFQCGAG